MYQVIDFIHNFKQVIVTTAILAVCCLYFSNDVSAEEKPAEKKHVGMKVENFTLKDYRGKDIMEDVK